MAKGLPTIRIKRGLGSQEPLALLKILALGRRQDEEGKTIPLAEAMRRLRARRVRR